MNVRRFNRQLERKSGLRAFEQLENRIVLSHTPTLFGFDGVVIEDFESGNLDTYTYKGRNTFSVSTAAHHDGELGMQIEAGKSWIYRDDASVLQSPNTLMSFWVRSSDASETDWVGNAYVGFGATSQGTYAARLRRDTGGNDNFELYRVDGLQRYETLSQAEQDLLPDHWYRVEIAWHNDGDIVARLFDDDGATLLNTLWANDSTYTSGGISFRAIGSIKQFDTIQVKELPPGVTAVATDRVTSENGSGGSLRVKLDTQPASDVIINLSSSDTSEGIIPATSLTFTPANWNEPQFVTVTGIDDNEDDGDVDYTIDLAIDTGQTVDADYVDLPIYSVPFRNLDNDANLPDLTRIYVWNIDFEQRQRGRNNIDYRVVVDIRQDFNNDVADDLDPAVAGVEVTIEFTKADGGTLQLTGTTDADGVFVGEWIKGLSSGLHHAEVISLSLDGQLIDSALGVSVNDEDWDLDGDPDESLLIP